MEQSTNKKPPVIKRVIDVIEWGLVLAAAGLALYVMINTAQGKAVKLFGNSLLHIVTGSMEPTVSVGDYIYIRDVEISDLKQGDIVAYYSEDPEIAGKLVLHRIVNINPDGTYQTMGDANPIPDKLPVRADQVAGRYFKRAGLFNWLASFVDPSKLLLLAVVVPLFLLSIYEAGTIAKIFLTDRKETSEEDPGEETEHDSKDRTKKRETREEAILRVKREAIEAYLAEHGAEEKAGDVAEPKTVESEVSDAAEPKGVTGQDEQDKAKDE